MNQKRCKKIRKYVESVCVKSETQYVNGRENVSRMFLTDQVKEGEQIPAFRDFVYTGTNIVEPNSYRGLYLQSKKKIRALENR